ncbi:MAG TPA: hypothetical protein VFF50_05705 [Candidatus Deferrimicrobiaceae bacterium]|jgi:hypothetical protein|nr:hypothetical protein [Candidatus Deferrimicrobiaceae bacterium]
MAQNSQDQGSLSRKGQKKWDFNDPAQGDGQKYPSHRAGSMTKGEAGLR